MKHIPTFLNLIRWPNLVIMGVTQFLFYFTLVKKSKHSSPDILILIICATLLIAAGGYIINDICDENTDAINKPKKIFIGTFITKRSAFHLYLLLNVAGLTMTVFLFLITNSIHLIILNILSVMSLYLYSKHLKGTVLIGNFVIALLSAWVILIFLTLRSNHNDEFFYVEKTYLILGYAIFAFLITLIRECIKDMEDIQGDRIAHLQTFPVVMGMKAAKNYVISLVVLTGLFLSVITFYYVMQMKWMLSIYIFLLILAPMIYLLKSISKAENKNDYHRLSTISKFIMGTGIISIIFFIN